MEERLSKPVLINWLYITQPNLFLHSPDVQQYRFYVKLNSLYMTTANSYSCITRRKAFALYRHLSTKGQLVGYEIIHSSEFTPVVSSACLYLLAKDSKRLTSKGDLSVIKSCLQHCDVKHYNGLHVSIFKNGSALFIARPSGNLTPR